MAIRFTIIVIALLGTALNVSAETLVVPGYNENGVWSSPLVAGQWYMLTASGTYQYDLPNTLWADAEFIQCVDYVVREYYWNPNGFHGDEVTDYGDLVVNDVAVDWLGSADGATWLPHTSSPDHVYRYFVQGTGSPLFFRVADDIPFGPDYTWNNSGALTLQISTIPEPASLGLLALGGLALLRRNRS